MERLNGAAFSSSSAAGGSLSVPIQAPPKMGVPSSVRSLDGGGGLDSIGARRFSTTMSFEGSDAGAGPEALPDAGDGGGDARLRARWFLARSGVGAGIELLNVTLSACACILYIAHTYARNAVPEWMTAMEAGLQGFFVLHLVLHLALAPHRGKEMLTTWFLVNLASVAPLAVVGITSAPSLWVRLLRIATTLRVVHISHLVGYLQNDVQRQLLRIVVVVVTLTFTAASIIEVVENDSQLQPVGVPLPQSHIGGLSITNSAYFIITTLTTVGYGDISPVTAQGRLTVVVLIGVAFLTVPRETNRLVELLSKQTVYGRQRFEPSASTQHVVVCGAVGSVPTASGGADAGAGGGAAPGTSLLRLTGGTSGIIAFVREFFNDDHGTSGRHLVILARGPPSPDLAVVLAQPKHVVGITYLDGDVMSDRDLGRAAVSKAAGVFILSNKLAADMDAEDSASIIRALAVHRHSLLSTAVASPQLFVQLLRPENRALFSTTISQLKASLLSKSCVCPGFATVLFNLVASDPDDASAGMDAAVGAVPPSPPPAAATLSTAQGSPSAEAAPSPASSARRWPEQGNVTNSEDTTGGSARDGDEWIDQYRQGSSYEMYRVILSAAFEGVTFEAAASLVHEELGVLLIGVEIQPPEMKSSRVLLNPVGFVLPHPSDDRVHGLVIAEDRAQADLLSHEPAWLRSSAASGSFVSRGRSRRGSGASRQRAGPADAIPSASAPWIVEAMSMSPKPGRGGPGTTRRQASAGSSVGGSAAVLAIADDGTASGRLMERLGKTAAQNRERALTGRRVSRAAIPPDLATPNRGAARSVTAQAAQPGSVQPSTTALPAAGAGARAPPDEALADMEAARWLSTSHKKMRREQARAARTNVPARTLAEATLASTSDPASGLRAFSGHVVVMCRRRPGDLLDFVQPLRARHLARFPPIVVLCPEPPRDEHWLKLSAFPQVWFVLGSPMRAADLVRVGLASAACCVMYEQADGGPVAVDATRSDALIDADAICVYRLIRSIAPAAEIVVEVARLESVAFLDDAGGADSLCPATERLAFSAGHVFTSSFVDICLCQAFFNQHIITIVEHLVGVGDTAPCREWDRSAVAARLGKPVSSNVYSVAVPRSLVGKTLGDAFRALCVTRGMLPIGLRRRRVAAPGSSVDNSSAAEELSRRLAGSLAAVNESDTEEEEEDNFSYRPAGEPWDGPEAVGFAGASEMDGDELESLSSTPEPPMTKRGVEGSPPRGPGSSRDEQHDGKAGVWRVANVASRASAAVRASRAEGSNAGSAYVVTNPPASLVLRRSDSMFVLAARAPEPADARDALPRIASLSDLRRGRSFK